MTTGIFNFRVISRTNTREVIVVMLLLVLARITKRAQIPLSAWLPAAIAAPTPVSALVHSSTLVTAGVYLIIRFNSLITSSGLSFFLLTLGLITTLIAGGSALFELDIKKVIALSTLRQLGIIFFRLGISFPFLAFFHLISHAYFKAILFMAAGAIIHRVKDYQDFRKMGRRFERSKFLRAIILAANISLCGFPFITGFYSKDLILELTIAEGMGLPMFLIIIIATLLTLIYSLRFSIFLIMLASRRESFRQEIDANTILKAGPRVLLVPSLIGGY